MKGCKDGEEWQARRDGSARVCRPPKLSMLVDARGQGDEAVPVVAVVGIRSVVAMEVVEMPWSQCGAGARAAAEGGLRC